MEARELQISPTTEQELAAIQRSKNDKNETTGVHNNSSSRRKTNDKNEPPSTTKKEEGTCTKLMENLLY